MNRDPRPGRTARLAAAVEAERRLRAPAPIGWDASKAELSVIQRFEAVIGAQQARDFDGRPVRDAEDSDGARDPRDLTGGATDRPQARAAAPIDWTSVTIDADQWTSWIDVPPGGWGKCPIPLVRAGEWEYRVGPQYEWRGDDEARDSADFRVITAIRLRARPASDTEELPVGAVVLGWSPLDTSGRSSFYKLLPSRLWSAAWHTPEKAAKAGGHGEWLNRADATYLPVNLAEGGV